MITEGEGKHPPARKLTTLSLGELICLNKYAEERAWFRDYAKRKDAWGRGLVGAMYIEGIGHILKEIRPILAGLVGEWAVAQQFGCGIDTLLRRQGDGGVDMVIEGLPIQIKTCEGITGANLLKVRAQSGFQLSQKARVLVFCEWVDVRWMAIRGWLWMKDALEFPEVRGRRGPWWNVEIEDRELLPMCALKRHVAARRKLLGGSD